MIYHYLGVDWTKVRLHKNNMNVKPRKNDEREWEDISVPDAMWVWLNGKCGARFTSMIMEANGGGTEKPMMTIMSSFSFVTLWYPSSSS